MSEQQGLTEFIQIVESWNVVKKVIQDPKDAALDMRKFVEAHNAHTRRLISAVGRDYPDFWTGVFELAMNAQTLTSPKAKIFADGLDRTNV